MKKHFLITVSALFLFCNSICCQLKYNNPILAGFYPDPSICRAGSDYYLVNSSFSFFPGLPLFHSKDLVNWKQIGNALDRNTQLPLSGASVSGGLFAPTIRYYRGVFYIICTNVSHGGNFIITAKDATGPWSDPVYLPDVNGIDPSLFFDDNGKAYIVYNSIPPDNKSLYNGHRTIRIIEYNVQQKKTMGGNKIIVNGGTDIESHPVWIEGPHLYKINKWYYLMCAQGGTAEQHSEVVFRSKNAKGPFMPYSDNPILTQRDLDSSRKYPITSTGHADLVETPDGRWYSVFLGCRPYEKGYYNTGRETFMVPVCWRNGWPVIMPKHSPIKYQYPVPFSKTKKIVSRFNGNYHIKEDFDNNVLSYRFVMLRDPQVDLYHLSDGFLQLSLKAETVAGSGNPAFIGFRQAHSRCWAATRVSFSAKSASEMAGLLAFQNEQHYYFLCKSLLDNKPVIALFRSATSQPDKEELIASAALENDGPLELKIVSDNDIYDFYYAEQTDRWKLLKAKVDARYLSTETAGGFVGCMLAMYATSKGTVSDNKALYDWFEYQGHDDIYQ